MPNEYGQYRYKDRLEAGAVLAEALKQYAHQPGVVLAIPRGGVPVGYVVAKELGFALDIILTKKIGHPFHREYAVGAVSLTGRTLVPHERVSDLYIESETVRIREQLREMYQLFKGDTRPEPISGKITILIDDGIATGSTIQTSIDVIQRESPSKLIIAVPVAARDAIMKLSQDVDEIVCPVIPGYFTGVGAFYEDFTQVSHEEVRFYLNHYR